MSAVLSGRKAIVCKSSLVGACMCARTATVSLTCPMSYRYPAMSRFVFLRVSNFMRQWCVTELTKKKKNPRCQQWPRYSQSCADIAVEFHFFPSFFSFFTLCKKLSQIRFQLSSKSLAKKIHTGHFTVKWKFSKFLRRRKGKTVTANKIIWDCPPCIICCVIIKSSWMLTHGEFLSSSHTKGYLGGFVERLWTIINASCCRNLLERHQLSSLLA